MSDGAETDPGPDATSAASGELEQARPPSPPVVHPARKNRFRRMVAIRREGLKVQVLEMYLARTAQADIALALKIGQTTVSKYIKEIEAEWRDERKRDIDEHRARELAELNEMERNADIREKAAAGDKRSYAAVAWAQHRLAIKDRKARLLGLDAPKKVEVEAPVELVVRYVNNWDGVKPE